MRFRLLHNRPSLEMEQATLFSALGLTIVLSQGQIINDDLYGIPMWKAMLSGATQLIIGIGYWWAICTRSFFWRHIFSIIAALVWFSFVGLYLSGPYHKIGAVTCGVFALFRIYDDAWMWHYRRSMEANTWKT